MEWNRISDEYLGHSIIVNNRLHAGYSKQIVPNKTAPLGAV